MSRRTIPVLLCLGSFAASAHAAPKPATAEKSAARTRSREQADFSLSYNALRLSAPALMLPPQYEKHLLSVSVSAEAPALTMASIIVRVLPGERFGRSYLSVHRLGGNNPGAAQPGNASLQVADVETYQLHHSPLFFAAVPQFSPDGRYILFECGDLFVRNGLQRLYVLDRQTKKLVENTPDGLFAGNRQWSPDSTQFFFFAAKKPRIAGSDGQNELQARLFDVKSRRSLPVPGVAGAQVEHVQWTSAGTLLFTRRNRSSQPAPTLARPGVSPLPLPPGGGAGSSTTAPAALPVPPVSIFEAGLRLRPRLVVSAAERPLPSPDGKWIACFSPLDATPDDERDMEAAQQGLYQPEFSDKAMPELGRKLPSQLMLYNRQTRKRLPISPAIGPSLLDEGKLLWTADSKNLIKMEVKYMEGEAQASISTYNVETRQWAELALMRAKEEKDSTLSSRFRMVSTQSPNQSLLVTTTRWGAREEDSSLIFPTNTLQSVDLRDGRVSDICTIKGGFGSDWHQQHP